MWILRSQKSGTTYHLFVGQTYSAGRKDTDILIENDPSISRKHATLTVTYPEGNLGDPSKLPALKIQDVGSKYGTSRNGDRIKGETVLEDGDNVKFGQFDSVFSVSYVPFIVTTSCVENAVKKELKKAIYRLGGHLVSEWKTNCTHLVMSDIKITIKAVCCLISQKPLVTPAYVSDMVKNISAGLSEPVTNKYIPPVGEAVIDENKVNFDIVPERKDIFKNKTFLFIDMNQLKKMGLAVELGGGEAVYASPDSPVEVLQTIETGACFVQPQIQNASVSICQQKVLDFLQRNNKRMIQESDFGLAVAYCSTEMFCNPDYNIGNSQLGISRLYSQTLTQQEVSMHVVPRSGRKSDTSFTEEKTAANQTASASVEDVSVGNTCGKKRKSRNSSGNLDAIQHCSKQTKLENFLKISSSKPSNQEKAVDSISIEGIALRSSSVKEEPQSADEMDMDNNSVFVDSPVTVECPASSAVDLNSSVESSNRSTRNISRENKKLKPGQSSNISNSKQNGFLNSRNQVSGHKVDVSEAHNDEEKDLPKNLIKVEFADLVCVKPRRASVLQNNTSSSVQNFKKFRKILPLAARLLPQIIGGHELEPYSKQASKALDDILNDSCDVQQPNNNLGNDDAGEFDWESQPRQRKR